VSPTTRLRVDIDELFSSDRELSSILEDVARLSVRPVMQVAVEAEVDEFLGRARCQRRDDEDRAGSRPLRDHHAGVSPSARMISR
jgi:hypothetical protein